MKINMKKIFILTLVLIIIFASSACGGSDTPALETPPPPAATPDEVLTAPPEPLPEPAPEPMPVATPEPEQESSDETPPDDLIVFDGYPFPFAFTAEDIYGNTVTEASLGEKELFFIHYWGTWCPPCIAEMPDLAQLERDYEDRVGFLVLLDDFDNKDVAIEIYNHYDFPDIENSITICGRTTFNAQHEIMKMLNIEAVPTTIIIDPDGNMLEYLLGAHFSNYAIFLDMHLGN